MDYKTSVLSELETMKLGEMATGGKTSRFKAIAYDKAIRTIRAIDGPLTNAAQVKDLSGVGDTIYKKVAEVIATGVLGAATKVRERTDVDAMRELLEIHGVGPVKARELIAAGYKSVAELRAAVSAKKGILNKTQLLGLKYYEATLERIPREEMSRHEAAILSGLPKSLSGVVVGSYRRGAATSGDIDVLVSYPAEMTETAASALFQTWLGILKESGYIVDTLASGDKKWLGYARLGDGNVRRLDLLLTPPLEFPYAILYFTGSDKFNVAFRRWCLAHGYTLNEHTLKPVEGGSAAAVPLLNCEEAIFDFVGLRWVPPTARVDGDQVISNLE